MALPINNKVGFKVGATSPANINLSTWVTSFTINHSAAELDVTAMGDTGMRVVKGLEQNTISVDLLNENGTSGVLQTLQTLWGTNAYFACIQDSTAAISASNPLYTGLILVNNTTDIAGAVSDIVSQSLTFTVSGALTIASTGTW